MTAVLLVVVAVAAALFGAGLDELVHHLAGRYGSGNFPEPVTASTSSLTVVKMVSRTILRRVIPPSRTAHRVKARFVNTGRHTERRLRKAPQLTQMCHLNGAAS